MGFVCLYLFENYLKAQTCLLLACAFKVNAFVFNLISFSFASDSPRWIYNVGKCIFLHNFVLHHVCLYLAFFYCKICPGGNPTKYKQGFYIA